MLWGLALGTADGQPLDACRIASVCRNSSLAWLHLSFTEALWRLRAVVGACAGIIAGALLALWDLAAVRCAGAGSWCMRAVSGSLSSSSVHSGPDGASQHYYQAVTDDLPSEYWVCCL